MAAKGPEYTVGINSNHEPIVVSDMFTIIKFDGKVYRSNSTIPAMVYSESHRTMVTNLEQERQIERMIQMLYEWGQINLMSWTLLYDENI